MSTNNQNFFVVNTTEYEESVIEENVAIKGALNILIQELTERRNGTFKATKIAIEEQVKKRLEEEVEELLADEQRATSMGQWA